MSCWAPRGLLSFCTFYFSPSWGCFASIITLNLCGFSMDLTVVPKATFMLLSTLSGWCGTVKFLDTLLSIVKVNWFYLHLSEILKRFCTPNSRGGEHIHSFTGRSMWCTWLGVASGYLWEQYTTDLKRTSETIWSYSFWIQINPL